MPEQYESFKLTRFLYNEEEVKLSLITSLLNKKNLLESYYWFSELYYSKLDICDIIWEIYFDYYALINPKLEQYICKKINDWKEKQEIEHLLYIIKNLNISKHDCRVFLLRQISNSPNLCQTFIYLDCKSKTIKDYDNKYHHILISLKYKRWIDICYYLKKLFITLTWEIYSTVVPRSRAHCSCLSAVNRFMRLEQTWKLIINKGSETRLTMARRVFR